MLLLSGDGRSLKDSEYLTGERVGTVSDGKDYSHAHVCIHGYGVLPGKNLN